MNDFEKKKEGAAMRTQTHLHWDVTQGEETYKRVHTNDIIIFHKEGHSLANTHTNTRTRM